MIYLMRCDTCKRYLDIGCPINQHEDIIKPGIACGQKCLGILRQVITPPRLVFGREPFPHSGNEVALPTNHFEDIRFQDKIHAREYLGERGLMSKWIENDM